MAIENLLNKVNKIVIKLGTAAITKKDESINYDTIHTIARSCHELLDMKKSVSIVTSGAIACGRGKTKSYSSTNNNEMLSAIGQPILMQAYIDSFSKYGINVGQILLTSHDFDSRKSLGLLWETFSELQHHKDIPIINENDAIATEEITFGDNDFLASNVTVDLGQDMLLILTVYDNLIGKGYNALERGTSFDVNDYVDLSDEVRRGGSGGLTSKLNAVKKCVDNGKICRIGNVGNGIISTLSGKSPSTTFYP
ncbi:MAG: hypothetical protein V1660_00140 [archaeon]